MLTDLISLPVAKLIYIKACRKEKELGYRLILPQLDDQWINGYMMHDLSATWRRIGLAASGVNYWTTGSVKDGQSLRFKRDSLLYQSWFGGYLVRLHDHHTWSQQDYWRLAEADQRGWLTLYGDPKPKAEIIQDSVIERGTLELGAYSGKLYCGRILSHSDRGAAKISVRRNLILAGIAHHFNFSDGNLHLRGSCFMPRFTSLNDLLAYHDIELVGLAGVISITERIKAVIYANGASFYDLNDREVNTYDRLEDDLVSAITRVEIVKI